MTYGQQPHSTNDAPQAVQPGQPPVYGSQSHQYGYGAAAGQAGYAGWGAPTLRPGSVTGGCVMAIIGGVLAMLLGGLFLVVAGILDDPEVLAGSGFTPEAFVVLGGVVLLVGALVVLFAVMAMRGRYWAALALAVMGGLYVALAIVSIIQGQGGVLVGILWIGISLSMLMSSGSRAWFRAQR